MSAPARAPVGLDSLSLRKSERGFVVGGVGTGKSSLMDMLGADFTQRYPTSRRLILDSKPRYRAERTVQGMSAARRYKRWSHGQAIPGSVLVHDPADLHLAWSTGARVVIAQGDDRTHIPRLMAMASEFLRQAKASRPQMLQVDETMDFFHGNGSPIGGDDAIVKVARAGRERGCSGLYGAQRTKGIPATLMEEMTRLYCLRIDFRADAKRLQEMGAPPFPLPTEPHQFMYWTKHDYSHVWGPYKLRL